MEGIPSERGARSFDDANVEGRQTTLVDSGLEQMFESAVALCGHPYATAVAALVILVGALSTVLMIAWFVYEAYVHAPAHRRQRQWEKRRARVNVDSAFGLGFKSCPESVEAMELAVEGELPRWLAGKLFRSGPGTLDVETELGFAFLTTHWFDGLTMMHGFEIKDGRVFYANRKVASEVESYIARHGGRSFTFGPDPCKTFFNKLSSLFISESKDPRTGRDIVNNGVTIRKIRGKLYDCSDANSLVSFDAQTLATSGSEERYSKFNRDIKGQLSAAHGQYDAARGEYYNLAVDIGLRAVYSLFVVPDVGEARVLCKIPVAKASYLHSFALTENYFILQLTQRVFNIVQGWPLFINGPKVLWHKSLVDGMEWEGDAVSKFYVVSRSTGELLHVYETPSAFCFHNINAWEEDDANKIVIDLALYKDNSPINDLLLDNILARHAEYTHSPLVRFTLTNVKRGRSRAARRIAKQVVYGGAIELPRINPRHHMKPYSYAYGVSAREHGHIFDRLIKVNVRTGVSAFWEVEGHFPAEPIFLPTPEGHEEDDGVLLSIVLNGNAATSYLLVLNAKDMSEVARAQVPHHVPFGFHGNFFGEYDLNSDIV